MEGAQDIGAEVRDDAVGRTPTAAGAAYEALGRAEEALQFVRRHRDPRVVEAVEQVLAVETVPVDEVVDEVTPGRPQTCPRSRRPQVVQVGLEPLPGFLRGRGSVLPVRRRRDVDSSCAMPRRSRCDAAPDRRS